MARIFITGSADGLGRMAVSEIAACITGKNDLLWRISYNFGDRTRYREENCDRSTEGAQVPIN